MHGGGTRGKREGRELLLSAEVAGWGEAEGRDWGGGRRVEHGREIFAEKGGDVGIGGEPCKQLLKHSLLGRWKATRRLGKEEKGTRERGGEVIREDAVFFLNCRVGRRNCSRVSDGGGVRGGRSKC